MTDKTIQIKVLPLKSILADFEWNGRHASRAKLLGPHVDSSEADGDSEAPGLEGIATSMATVGQDTPVDVCIATDGPHKGKMFLAAGFRRYAAVEYLQAQNPPAAVKGLAPGEIVARVREGMTETEVRDLNNRENVRDNLPVADLAYAVGERLKLMPKVTNNEIAAVMGKSASYISTLATLVTGLKPKIFTAWRGSITRPVSSAIMLSIAKSPKSEQDELYQEALNALKPKAASAGDKGGLKWIDLAVKNATTLGRQLGTLTRLGVIKGFDDTKSTNVEECIRDVVKIKERYTIVLADGTKQKKTVGVTVDRRVTKALRAGFQDGLEEPEASEEEEDENEEEET